MLHQTETEIVRLPIINAHFKIECLKCGGNPLRCTKSKHCPTCNIAFCPVALIEDGNYCPNCKGVVKEVATKFRRLAHAINV